MSLVVDKLKSSIKKEGKKVDSDLIIKNNISDILLKATEDLLNKASNSDLDLDIKDIKDLASVLALLKQGDNDTSNSGAPEITNGASDFYNKVLGTSGYDTKDEQLDISDNLEELDASNVQELLDSQFLETNEENESKI